MKDMCRFLRKSALGWVVLIFVALSLGLPGCAGKSVDEGDPTSLMKDAEGDIKSDHYQVALDKLRVIKNKFPYSPQAIEAQLKIADVYFMQESWTEAATSYETFRDLHPKHEKAPYAMFRVGKSYFNDIPSPISRDLTPATKALDAYNDFVKRHPNAPEAKEAREDIGSIRRILAEKELYIANFYYKRDYYESAKPRFEKILEMYPETEPAKEAKTKLERTLKFIEDEKREKAKEEKKEPGKDGRSQGQ